MLYLHFVLRFVFKVFLYTEKSYVCCGVVFTLCTVVYLDVLGQCEKSCCIYTLYCFIFKMFLDNVKSHVVFTLCTVLY